MRRRRVVADLIVLALVVPVAIALWPHGPRPCRATFEQVRVGMTFEEVCATVGGPPGDYAGGPRYVLVLDGESTAGGMWTAADGRLFVWFDGDDRVISTEVIPTGHLAKPSFWRQVLDHLGL